MIWSAMIARIPVHLRSCWLTSQYYYECELNIFSKLNPNPLEPRREFETGIRALVSATRPHQAYLAIGIFFRRMGACSSSGTSPPGMWRSKQVHICKLDEPTMVADCESILVKIPTSDTVKAYRMVREAFAEKRRRLEKHRSHRVCFVHLGLRKSLERLEIAEQKIREVMENLPGFPKPS
jgi:hypothetical protein